MTRFEKMSGASGGPVAGVPSGRPRSQEEVSPRLHEAVDLMEANLQAPLRLVDLADQIGLSRRQLERLFERHLSCPPARYYLRLRLLRARQLLRRTRLPVTSVATGCGFRSAQSFSRSYREHFGIAPGGERMARPLATPP
ncbi:putative transcriptional regulator [Stutzerimonas stutzeri TS44]|nr:putative transcriptional regulator [Stutzerimonas stutzeri TS44]